MENEFFRGRISRRLLRRFNGIEDIVNSRPQPSRQHAVRSPKSPVLYSGQCAWGKRFAEDGITLEVDEYEQNVTAVVRHMRATGYKLRQIVDSLRELGVVGRTGKPIGTTFTAREKSRAARRMATARTACTRRSKSRIEQQARRAPRRRGPDARRVHFLVKMRRCNVGSSS